MLNPNLHPTQQPRPTKSHAEHRVYEALQTGLPPGWTAWHSLRIHDDAGAEGEGDFILIDPDRGMLIIEVKGGGMEARDGRWFQNGKPLDHSPRDCRWVSACERTRPTGCTWMKRRWQC